MNRPLFKGIRMIPLWLWVLIWIRSKPIRKNEPVNFMLLADLAKDIVDSTPKPSEYRSWLDGKIHKRFLKILMKCHVEIR